MDKRSNASKIPTPKVNKSYSTVPCNEPDLCCEHPEENDKTQIESQFILLEKEISYTRDLGQHFEDTLQPILRPALTEIGKDTKTSGYTTTVPLAQRLEGLIGEIAMIRCRLANLRDRIEL